MFNQIKQPYGPIGQRIIQSKQRHIRAGIEKDVKTTLRHCLATQRAPQAISRMR